MKGRLYLLSLSVLSALLLSASWYWHLTVCVFFALVPLLVVEDRISTGAANLPKPRLSLLRYAYICFLLWNVLVTWWVVYASTGGALMAFLANSLLMSLVFLSFSVIKNRLNKPWGTWLLIPLWIGWEHAHTLWDLTWTWLSLGNVFAFKTSWVQWYEYTGTSGGSLWILASNILVFQAIKKQAVPGVLSRPILRIAAVILLPILLSYLFLIRASSSEKDGSQSSPLNVLVVQPNIDPYNSKFSLDYQSQFFKVLDLIRGKIGDHTDYLVLPETFITDDLNENVLGREEAVQWFRDSLIRRFPRLKIVTGANTYRYYHSPGERTATARPEARSGRYYDMYNSAVYIDRDTVAVYHKSKLVPGVERMPFPALLKPLESMAIDMGGTVGSLGIQEQRDVFRSTDGTAVAPVICYESVYADYVTGYIRLGAGLIFIITNDGWWEDTPGYIQHLNYARLRAIENRRAIARSANTGISCFIDPYGRISDATGWWEEAVIEQTLSPRRDLTFFSRFGDLTAYLSLASAILLILWCLFLRFKR